MVKGNGGGGRINGEMEWGGRKMVKRNGGEENGEREWGGGKW